MLGFLYMHTDNLLSTAPGISEDKRYVGADTDTPRTLPREHLPFSWSQVRKPPTAKDIGGIGPRDSELTSLEKAGKLALSESAPDKQRIICKTAIAQNIIPISSPESYNRRPEIVPRSAEPGSATIPDARKAHLHQLPSLQPRNEELAQRGFIKQRLPHAMRVTHTANLFKWFFATVVERW